MIYLLNINVWIIHFDSYQSNWFVCFDLIYLSDTCKKKIHVVLVFSAHIFCIISNQGNICTQKYQ